MDKLLWVTTPPLLAAAVVLLLWWRGALPSRRVLNAAFSALLLVYVLVTAGLGIFWVANQHLPVFDWHYVFGYVMLALLAVHLGFNLRSMWTALRRPAPRQAAAAGGRRSLVGAFGVFGIALAGGVGYFIGLRHGRTELRVEAGGAGGTPEAAQDTARAVVERFHGFSAHSRAGVFRRAPSLEWGEQPPPFKTVAGSRWPLPTPRSAAAPGLDAALLSDLLWHAAGVSARSAGILFRTAPSSGALFASELYVGVRSLPGVPPAWWHHDVPGRALVRVADLEVPLPGIGALPADAAAVIVATAWFARSGHKYRDRTYRYVLADLGHLLENLRVVARAAGARLTLLPVFEESRVARSLQIDEKQEGVIAVLLLQPGAAGPLPALQPAHWAPATGVDAYSRPLGVTEAIHAATSLRATVPDATGACIAPVGEWVQSRPQGRLFPLPSPGVQQASDGPVTAVPRGGPAVTDPLPLIARRRSSRRYGRSPLSSEELGALLASMASPGPLLSGAIGVDVIVHAAEGLDAGAWRYHPGRHALELRRAAADPDAQRSASRAAGLDQDVIGDAAVVFVFSFDRAALVREAAGAARAYRHAFIEVGLMSERIYLEATARGLGVCAVGAFYDDEMAACVAADPGDRWVVHLTAVGRAGRA